MSDWGLARALTVRQSDLFISPGDFWLSLSKISLSDAFKYNFYDLFIFSHAGSLLLHGLLSLIAMSSGYSLGAMHGLLPAMASLVGSVGSVSSVQALSHVRLCDPMDCSTPGLCEALHGFCGAQGSVVVAHGLRSRSSWASEHRLGRYDAWTQLLLGIFLAQGLNPCLLHWQMDSLHWAIREAAKMIF